MRRVLILGGGTGGTLLANLLARRPFDVTVLSASDAHLFQPSLLYAALAGASPRLTRPERRLLSRRVRLVRDTAVRVDLRAKRVRTASGSVYESDALVVATGARAAPAQIPGLSETAARFGNYHSDVAAALRLRAALDAFRGGTIAVGQASPICVCPPSPAEGVFLIDRLLRRRGLREKTRLVFFTPYPRPYPAAAIDALVAPRLRALGVEVRTVFDVESVDPATGTIRSLEGDELRCDLPVIVPPFAGAAIEYEPADVLDEDRFLAADKATLRLKGVDDAYAIGDAAALPTSKAGVGAHLQAKVVAAELTGKPAAFDGRTHCPFDLGDGTGVFVTSSYSARAVPCRPRRLNLWMKKLMPRVYWLSLSGLLEPIFDAYFALTAPQAAPAPPAPAPPREPAAR
ncbi:MAG: FAD-dependent oxidoreductase [Elusimicrobia bacterium]|nr:FAD-dependent oxidoreductase [Elusimicrobiota bacterium]